MLKDFIYTWKHVNLVNSLNKDLKKTNNELKIINKNYEKSLEKVSREIGNLTTKIRFLKTENYNLKDTVKVDYLMIERLLNQLESVNRSGLTNKTKEQNQIINEIRKLIEKELDNAEHID